MTGDTFVPEQQQRKATNYVNEKTLNLNHQDKDTVATVKHA